MDLHSCHHEDQQTSFSRTGASPEEGAALVCHQGIKAQATVKQLFPVPINLMQGNVFLRALHLTLAQVISGRQIELPLVT